MTTRASRRGKVSLHEEEASVPVPRESPPPSTMTTRTRRTRRYKENDHQEEKERCVVGQFVKCPQATPTKAAHSEGGRKSTRNNKNAAVLKEDNTRTAVSQVEEPGEHELEVMQFFKPDKSTRRRKKVSSDITDGVSTSKELNNVAESPKIEVKIKNNNRKAPVITFDFRNGSDINILQDSKKTVENSLDSNNLRKSKRRGVSKKIPKEIEVETSDFLKEKLDSTFDMDKTAGSFVKKSSPKHLEISLSSVNTSVDSFHSATSSPSPADLTLVPDRADTSQLFDKALNTTYDKTSLNSTITLSTENTSIFTTEISQNKTPSIPNNLSPTKKKEFNKKISIQKSSTPNAAESNDDKTQKCDSDAQLKLSIAEDRNEQLNLTYDKSPERRSSRISNQSEKQRMSEDIFNTTVVLIDSSTDTTVDSTGHFTESASRSSQEKQSTSLVRKKPHSITPTLSETFDTTNVTHVDTSVNLTNTVVTPHKLIREGTFTKDSPDVILEPISPSEAIPSGKGSTESLVTPTRVKISLPAPGSTPYHSRRTTTPSANRSSVLNLTHSIEKDKRHSSSITSVPQMTTMRQTRVMFCSPVLNAIRDTERKSKIIKSSLKGSNKSFVFEETCTPPRPQSRKRSYTHNDADDVSAKRKKLTGEELSNSVNRLSRSTTTAPTSKQSQPPMKDTVTPSKAKILTPRKSRSETKPTSVRSKLPDFAALHRRQFNKMESLSECQERKALRAKQMLQFPPTGVYTLDGRRSPKVTSIPIAKGMPEKPSEVKLNPQKTSAPLAGTTVQKQSHTKSDPSKHYTRFGFKVPTDVNLFSIPSVKVVKPNQTNENIHTTISNPPKRNETITRAKFTSTIPSLRREKSKQMLTRDKSSTIIAEKKKKENRDIIKGVRTNRRFELQMKSRNVNG